MKTTKKSKTDLLTVTICEAKPHSMPHLEELRPWIRFLKFNHPVSCAACGKKKRGHWTMLCEFVASDFENSVVVLQNFPGHFAPLTAVCDDHPIGPAGAQ